MSGENGFLKGPWISSKKLSPFLKKHLRLLLQAARSHQRENIPQCPGKQQQFSELTDYINILYIPSEISIVPHFNLLFTTSKLGFIRLCLLCRQSEAFKSAPKSIFFIFFTFCSLLRCFDIHATIRRSVVYIQLITSPQT